MFLKNEICEILCMSKEMCYVNGKNNVMLAVCEHFVVEVAKYCNIDHHSSLILIAAVDLCVLKHTYLIKAEVVYHDVSAFWKVYVACVWQISTSAAFMPVRSAGTASASTAWAPSSVCVWTDITWRRTARTASVRANKPALQSSPLIPKTFLLIHKPFLFTQNEFG